jgi:hypothetical protein
VGSNPSPSAFSSASTNVFVGLWVSTGVSVISTVISFFEPGEAGTSLACKQSMSFLDIDNSFSRCSGSRPCWESYAPVVLTPTVKTNAVERASKYVSTMPPSISGAGGHDAAFKVAVVLVIGFLLSKDEARAIFTNKFNQRCDPILQVLRRELKRLSPDIRIEIDEIKAALIADVLKREVTDGDQAEAARRKTSRAASALRSRTAKADSEHTNATPEPSIEEPEQTPDSDSP